MDLTKCLKCGREISNSDSVCIHCGYSFSEAVIKTNDTNKLKKVVIPTSDSVSPLQIIMIVQRVTGLGLKEAKELVENNKPVILDKIDEITAKDVVNQFLKVGINAKVVDSDNNVNINVNANERNIVNDKKSPKLPCCPKCCSNTLKTEKQENSIISKIFGGAPVNVCQVCGHKFKTRI